MTDTTPNPPANPRTALIAVALVGLMLAPPAGALHLSVGAEDTVGLSPSEPPADTPDELYDRGTSTDCPETDVEDPSTLTADGFCGELVYNEGTTYEAISPQDQVSIDGTGPVPELTIDLQKTTYVGLYGTTTCSPWCQAPELYTLVHDTGQTLGVLDKGGEQAMQDDNGTQAYGGNVYAASPSQLYDVAGQHFLLPATDTSFVAFVTDDNGQPVSDTELRGIVSDAKDQDVLSEEAVPKVCAFTPNAKLGTHAPSAGRCEVALDWMGPGSEDENDACEADTYVCGENQPAWRGTTMCPMWHAACYLSDAWNSAHHFAIWHAVVAPSPPQECAASEPGFETDRFYFLAHDLDIHEPPTEETPATGVPEYWDQAGQNIPGLGPTREGRAPAVEDTPIGQDVQASPAFTQHEAEPNTDGWMGIPESSHTETQTRTIDECQTLASGEEEADPWVNVIDAHVTQTDTPFGVPAGAEPEPDHDPRPAMRVTGHVGLFTDVDDDGEYEQAPGSSVLDEVREYGAYPILWDHHEPGEGCTFRDGTSIGTLANEAGYTDPTGLAVTLRLSDGMLVHRGTGETQTVAQPTTVVFLSAGLSEKAQPVQDVIEAAAGDRPVLVLDDAFQPQCGEPTGGFTSVWDVYGEPLEEDGLAAAAIVTADEPIGSNTVPESPIALTGKTHVWWDVDPFENLTASD